MHGWRRRGAWLVGVLVALAVAGVALAHGRRHHHPHGNEFLGNPDVNAQRLVADGRQIFRFDTFGDEVFWTNQLQIQTSVAQLTPRQGLALGLKVDADALPYWLREAIRSGHVNLDDPAVTQKLLRHNAVPGVIGTFGGGGELASIGLTCAFCHSTVDDSVASGVGRRIDGLANRDLNVGEIIATAPNLDPLVTLLRLADPGIDANQVRTLLRSWGPGKFDAELFLDGKAFQPDGRSAATLLPNARGLAGFNLHTWTGGWGTVTYWNAFVAVLELHGVGTFFDGRSWPTRRSWSRRR